MQIIFPLDKFVRCGHNCPILLKKDFMRIENKKINKTNMLILHWDFRLVKFVQCGHNCPVLLKKVFMSTEKSMDSIQNSHSSFFSQFPAFAINTKNEVIWWNKACEELTGVSEKEILHTKEYWKAFFHTKKPLPLEVLLAKESEKKEQFQVLHFTGESCYGFFKIEKDLQGKSLLWLTACRMYDEEKNLAGAMMSFQPFFLRQFYWNSPLLSDVITRFPFPIVIALNGNITIANILFAELSGYTSAKEIVGRSIKDFLFGTDKALYEELKKNNYRSMETGREYQWKFAVGNEIRYVTQIPTIFRKDNDIVSVSTFIDKTEEIQKTKQFTEEKEKLLAVNRDLLKQLQGKQGFFVSESQTMKNVMEKALHLAKSDINMMLLGETGTGKSLMAKIIHEAGARRDKPFVVVNCAAIPETLMESAFFGHAKGAFTNAHSASQGFLEAARGGTLFLDEVAELSPAMQAKLLHAVENKYFTPVGSTVQKACDVRIISATHRNLNQMLREKKLREDFFYRICVVDLYLPALRERKEDIPLLIDFFLNRFSGIDTPTRLPKDIMQQLVDAPWTGNIRELQNAILRYIATGEISNQTSQANQTIQPHQTVSQTAFNEITEQGENLLDIEGCKETTEKRCILYALQLAKGSKSQAALLLNLNPRTFRRYCAKYKI